MGWINGLLAISNVIFGLSVGIWFFYVAKKTKAKLLTYAGLMLLLAWLFYLPSCIDFITVITTNENIDNSNGLFGSFHWTLIGWAAVIQVYFVGEIVIQERNLLKRLLFFGHLALIIMAHYFLFFFPMSSYIYVYPVNPGEDLIYFYFRFGSPLFILLAICGAINLFYCGFGFVYKSIQSNGVLRKKIFISALGIIGYTSVKMVEGLAYLGIGSIMIRTFSLIAGFCWAFGLRVEPAEPEEKHPKKQVEIEESMFRLSKRPEHITEEEITFHKEQKICLVCKGKVAKYNVYICPSCDVLYCQNCAHTLENLENRCWVCGEPIDKSKPKKPFKQEEDKVIIDDSEKSLKM